MATATMILVICALVSFLLATVQAQLPTPRPINWLAVGLALLTIAYMIHPGA